MGFAAVGGRYSTSLEIAPVCAKSPRMCGRFTNQHSWQEIWEHYQAFLDSLNVNPGINLQPRYNIAPTQDVLCVVERKQ